jgi:tetratricopeptide (TPR) repeat protein
MSNDKNLTVDETFSLAVQNHQNNNLQDAQNYYQKVLKIDPSHVSTLYNLGFIFKALSEYQKAKSYFEKVIGINPTYANAHYNLGNIFKDSGQYQKAKSCYEKTIEIDPNLVDAHNNLGIIFKDLGEYQKAKECYEKAIEINPNYANAHNNLGVLFKELGEYQKALSFYEKAIKIDPNHVDAHNNLGVILQELGEYQKAKSCYEKVIEINPNYANAHNNLGVILQELGEYQKAIGCFKKTIEIDPNYTAAHNQLLKTLYFINNQSLLFKELESITKEGKINAVIGSICSRAEVKYGVKKENPFCNDPLNYVLKTNLTEKYDFKNVIINCVNKILKDDIISNREQRLITNGYQTAGNLFANIDLDTNEVQKIIHAEIENYRLHFKDSKEGFLKKWPTNYSLYGWLINMKKGGKLSAHMHDLGWLSGSIYINVPQKLEADSGNLVVCIADENDLVNKKNEKSIDVVTGNLCLFPSSLLHYTIPFESEESRIVLAFDVKQK